MDPKVKTAVERMLDCSASFVEEVTVVEQLGDQTVWSGTVSVFEIEGHPEATKAYAWSSTIEGSTKRRHYAVLHVPPVTSPQAAVRAVLACQYPK